MYEHAKRPHPDLSALEKQMKLIDLGWCIARLDTEKQRLTVMTPADLEEDIFVPAASVVIYGTPAIKRLRDTLNEEYPE